MKKVVNKKSNKNEDLELFSSLRNSIIFKKFESKVGAVKGIGEDAYRYEDFRDKLLREYISQNIHYIKTINDYPHVSVIIDVDSYDDILLKLYKKHEGISSALSLKDYDYLLRQFLIKNQEVELSSKLISSFFEEVHRIPTEKYMAVSLISGIDFKQERIELGNFKIIKTNLDDIRTNYGVITYDNINHIISKNKFLKDEKIFNILEYGELSLKKIKSPVFGGDFIRHTSSIFDRYFDDLMRFCYYMNGKRDTLSLKRKLISFDNKEFLDIYNLSDKKFSGGTHGSGMGEILFLDGEWSVFNLKINDIRFFQLIDKQKSGTELHLYNAITWVGKSLMNKDLEESFMQLFVGLESLSPKGGMPIDDFAAFLLGKSYEERLNIKERVKNFHDIRSRIVHQNIQSINVSEREYYDLLKIVKMAIHKIFTDSSLKNMNDLRNKVERIKYS